MRAAYRAGCEKSGTEALGIRGKRKVEGLGSLMRWLVILQDVDGVLGAGVVSTTYLPIALWIFCSRGSWTGIKVACWEYALLLARSLVTREAAGTDSVGK